MRSKRRMAWVGAGGGGGGLVVEEGEVGLIELPEPNYTMA